MFSDGLISFVGIKQTDFKLTVFVQLETKLFTFAIGFLSSNMAVFLNHDFYKQPSPQTYTAFAINNLARCFVFAD